MPSRPGSAPTKQRGAVARQREARVQFREGPDDASPDPFKTRLARPFERPQKPIPKDPLPDSDDEAKGDSKSSEMLTVTPRTALQLSSLSPSGDAKWWHVADTRIEELVQTMEGSSPLHSDHSPHKLARTYSCPSSTCRALSNAGQRKKPVPPSGTWTLDGGQSDASPVCRSPGSLGDSSRDAGQSPCSTGHCAPETFAASSTLLRDLSLRDAVAKGLPWPHEGRRSFDNWTSPKRGWTEAELLLSATKSGGLGEKSDRPSTAPERSSRALSGASTPQEKCRRPVSAASSGETRGKGRETMQRRARPSGLSRPTSSSSHSGDHVDQCELIQVELAFYDSSDRICVLIHPEARIGSSPGSCEPDKMTLKGMISQLTGIAPGNQRLLRQGFDVSDDQKTVRKMGIYHGDTVTIYNRTMEAKKTKGAVVLACTAKKLENQEKNKQQDFRRAAWLQASRREKKGTMMMPKWRWGIPPDNTKVGVGYNDLGKNSSYRFENYHPWHDLNQEDEIRLRDIRSHQTYTQPIEYASHGLGPHCQ